MVDSLWSTVSYLTMWSKIMALPLLLAEESVPPTLNLIHFFRKKEVRMRIFFVISYPKHLCMY